MKHLKLLLVSLLSLFAISAAKAETAPVTIDGLNYALNDDDGTAAVTGRADDSLKVINIPSAISSGGKTYVVNAIAGKAFDTCIDLTSISIPNSVTSIGDYAFSACIGLTSIEIPNSAISIGAAAFESCSGLKSIYISPSVKTIGKGAFWYCTSLTEVHISDVLKWCDINFIGDGANPLTHAHNLYLNDEKVSDLVIPDGISSVNDYAFAGCSSLSSIIIPNSVTSIGAGAFEGCSSLPSVIFPNSVTSIGAGAFGHCSSLPSVIIPNSVTSIGAGAFEYCTGLTSVAIPDGISSVNDYVFGGCSSLPSVIIPNSVTSIGTGAFQGCTGLTSIEIPNSVTKIGDEAFSFCYLLPSIVIPNSVVEIGDGAFFACMGIKELTIEDGDTDLKVGKGSALGGYPTYPEVKQVIGGMFCYSPIEKLYLGRNLKFDKYAPFQLISAKDWSSPVPNETLSEITLGKDMSIFNIDIFKGCSKITALTIPASVVRIEGTCIEEFSGIRDLVVEDSKVPLESLIFQPRALETLYLGRDLTELSFQDNTNLRVLEFGKYVTAIPATAFSGCTGLKEVRISDLAKWCEMNFGVNPLIYAHHLYLNGEELTNLIIPNSVNTIGSNAFSGCFGLSSVEIPNSVNTIGSNAFSGCIGLSSIEIPNSVTTIGPRAFAGCSGLKKIIISDGTKPLGIGEDMIDGANVQTAHLGRNFAGLTFQDNVALLSVTIGSNVTEIGDYSFSGCSNLSSVTFPDKIRLIGNRAFYNCAKMKAVGFPNQLESVGDMAFYGCENFTDHLRLSNRLGHIGTSAFDGCRSLATVEFGTSLTEIPSDAFRNCSLTSVVIPSNVKTIRGSAFRNNDIRVLKLGSGLESVGEYAFADNSLEAVYITASYPPYAEFSAFSSYDCPLYVSDESAKDIYHYDTRCWGRFKSAPMVLGTEVVADTQEISANPGEQIQLTAHVVPSDATLQEIFWHSTNPDVATVDNNGLVTMADVVSDKARSAAACRIIASSLYADIPMAEFEINVAGEKGIRLDKTQLTLNVGDAEYLTATLFNFDDEATPVLEWSSSDTAVATVTEDGLVTAIANGSAIVTVAAMTDGDQRITATCEVIVNGEASISGIPDEELPLEIYNLQGVRIQNKENLAPGIYIVRRGGEAFKIVVK